MATSQIEAESQQQVVAGTEAFNQGDRRAAKSAYERAIAIWPENATAHSNLGVLLSQMGAATEALKHLDLALKLEPTRAATASFRQKLLDGQTPPAFARLKCLFGAHTWDGCKCRGCRKIRGEGHDWSCDCEKCAKCGSTRPSAHRWQGCKCSACGKTRNGQHNWAKDCEKCSVCGQARLSAHDWGKDCEKCAKCGSTRPSGHHWQGCKCSTCAKTRDEQHNWVKDCEKCSACGQARSSAHDWGKDCEKCCVCGQPRSSAYDWGKDCEQWANWGSTRPSSHLWQGCKCSACGKTRNEQHNWAKDCEKCSVCGQTRLSAHYWGKDCEQCSRCRATRTEAHDWTKDCEQCSRCDTKRSNAHAWDGCKCKSCGKTRDEGHESSIDHETRLRCDGMIEIATLADLQSINNDLAGNYRVTADIDAFETQNWNGGRGFAPIGSGAEPFAGILDGNGHVIQNLYIHRGEENNIGLFGIISSSGEVRNLRLAEVRVSGDTNIGGLAGGNDGNITECHASGHVSGNIDVGGLVGVHRKGNIIACHNSCEVRGERCVGGLVGLDTGNITKCEASGSVTGTESVGGLVGQVAMTGNINLCQAFGAVSGNEVVGGLVGQVMLLRHSVHACQAFGTVSGSVSVGGLVGVNLESEIIECLASGKVSGKVYVGGLVGTNNGTTIKSFWNIQVTGQRASPGGGEGRTTSEMKQRATFIGWDFEKIWQIDEGKSYPALRCFASNNQEKTADGDSGVSSKAIPSQMKEALLCQGCGNRYRLPDGCIIMTMARTMNAFEGSIIIAPPSILGHPDVVYEITAEHGERLPQIIEENTVAIASVREALMAGETKRWLCRKCQTENEYQLPLNIAAKNDEVCVTKVQNTSQAKKENERIMDIGTRMVNLDGKKVSFAGLPTSDEQVMEAFEGGDPRLRNALIVAYKYFRSQGQSVETAYKETQRSNEEAKRIMDTGSRSSNLGGKKVSFDGPPTSDEHVMELFEGGSNPELQTMFFAFYKAFRAQGQSVEAAYAATLKEALR